MSGVHGALGWVSLAAAAIVIVVAASVYVAWDRRAGRMLARLTDILVVIATVLVFAALFLGGLLLITGKRPEQMLHVLYGVGALAALPVAMAVGIWGDQGRGRSRRRYAWVGGGAVALLILAVLLIGSG